MGIKILLVEDDESFARYVLKVLSKTDFDVIDYASDPEKVLYMIKNAYYDIIISDVNMPKINGFEMAKRIIKIKKGKTKFIFISGFVDKITDNDPTLNKSSLFISKPFKPEVLLKAIEDILK
jgi:two-component SAPR family response regulator